MFKEFEVISAPKNENVDVKLFSKKVVVFEKA